MNINVTLTLTRKIHFCSSDKHHITALCNMANDSLVSDILQLFIGTVLQSVHIVEKFISEKSSKSHFTWNYCGFHIELQIVTMKKPLPKIRKR